MHELPAVLLLAYGSPDRIEDVEPYFTHIRGGRPPSPESVENLRERYRSIGGKTPLTQITRQTASGLERELKARGFSTRVFVGMKHWHPFISETVREMHDEGIRDATVVVLAPHYSRLSVGGYKSAFEDATKELPMNTRFVEQWHTTPVFVEMMAGRVLKSLDEFPESSRNDVAVVFSAHSLPERIRTWNDPYERQLLESCQLVADRAKLKSWHFAWQSAGSTGEPWLGPDLCDYLPELHVKGVSNVLSVPIGFVSEHLEVLYDIDREAMQKARECNINLKRTEMPNATPEFIGVLADIVVETSGTTERS